MLPEKRIPTHPGEILQEQFLEPLGLSREDLASHLGIPVQRIDDLVHGTAGVTPELAWLLAQAFDSTPEFWLNLQRNHELVVQRPERVVVPLRKVS